ncbi:Zinc finger protein [Oopsacas minuta]|uniref:Zinc finger protein n=1 Tax=Oopsacas minuta TaxID=111878 RepID=A0AAV7K4X9_9METZ|nr:Zinc finger protein [Oopsacas minuta]
MASSAKKRKSLDYYIKGKKPHSIGESLLKPCILSAAKFVLGEESAKKLSKISLCDSTVKFRIDELADDIKIQVVEKVKHSPFFAIQCDETTDVSQCSQLLVHVRFIGNETLEEEMLFCYPLETSTKVDDILAVLSYFFDENNLPWDKLVGICTDGAPAMIGSRSGFITKVKKKNSLAVGTHCIIHREALAAKTLPVELMDSLNAVIKIVNLIKTSALNTRLFAQLCRDIGADHETLLFHTSVRWLSKGNMLERFSELKDEVEVFLENQMKFNLLALLHSKDFGVSLAYLVDIFEALNTLNRKLQGRQSNIICHYDAIRAFIAKLDLWKYRILNKNTASFPHLDEALKGKELNKNVNESIRIHLDILRNEFLRYFPDIQEERPEWKLIRNPFLTDVSNVPEVLQEEFLDMKHNSSAMDDFNNLSLEKFWVKYLPMYLDLSQLALRVLVQFSSTYLCETRFSTLVLIKSKYRSRMFVEADLRCALSETTPGIKNIVAKKQIQQSH